MASVRSSKIFQIEDPQELQEVSLSLHNQLVVAAHLTLEDGREFALPPAVQHALRHIIVQLAAGRDISINVLDRDYTFTEALYFLGTTDSYLTKLMEEGEIPYRQEGEEYRFALTDLIEYRLARRARRAEGVRLIQQLSEEDGAYGE